MIARTFVEKRILSSVRARLDFPEIKARNRVFLMRKMSWTIWTQAQVLNITRALCNKPLIKRYVMCVKQSKSWRNYSPAGECNLALYIVRHPCRILRRYIWRDIARLKPRVPLSLLQMLYWEKHRVGRVQSIFSSRRHWDYPPPRPRASVPPPPLVRGRGTLDGERGSVRVPIPTMGTNTVVLYL